MKGRTSTRNRARDTRWAKTAMPTTTSSSGCRAGVHGAVWQWTRRRHPCIITTCPRTYATRADQRPTWSLVRHLWAPRRHRSARCRGGVSGTPRWKRHVPPSTQRSRCLHLRLRLPPPSLSTRHGGISVACSGHVLRPCARRTPPPHHSPPLPLFPRIHTRILRTWMWQRWTPRWPPPRWRQQGGTQVCQRRRRRTTSRRLHHRNQQHQQRTSTRIFSCTYTSRGTPTCG